MNIKQAKGFSLLEMMVVLAILGIVLAIAAPQYLAWRQNQNLREAARDLSSDISFWKQRAVAENLHYRITFNQATNSYTILQGGQLAAAPYINLVPDVTKSPGNISAEIIMFDITFPGAQITIQPRGTTSAGTVRLQHTGLPGREANVIANTMGRVRVEYGSI